MVAAAVPLLCLIVATWSVGVLTAVPTITVSGRPIVIVFPEPEVSISPAVPAMVRVSLSRSIESAPPLSAWISKSCAVVWESTYALTALWVAS